MLSCNRDTATNLIYEMSHAIMYMMCVWNKPVRQQKVQEIDEGPKHFYHAFNTSL